MTTIESIKAQLMIMEPEGSLDEYCTSIKDIYENRYLIRELPYEDWIVKKVGGIILSTIREKKRFRQLPCLKVLRSIVKDKFAPALSQETVSVLFEIYRSYIFYGKDDYEWCVSSLLKGRELTGEEIEWLTDNWSKSNHLVNRLLRYPSNDADVSTWAKAIYKSGELPGRKSEVIARFIDGDFYNLLNDGESPAVLSWAVYYSLSSIVVKENMLNHIALAYDENELIEVCRRLELSEPLKVMLREHHA